MKKIVLCSDSHSHLVVLKNIANKHNDADYYWHLGDSECFNVNDIKPFISVMGNIDFNSDLPDYHIFEIDNHRFLLTHGHKQSGGRENLVKFGKEHNCDVVLYGHSHVPSDSVVQGVRLINPGSCFNNRNGINPTYCILNLNDDNTIDAEYYEIDNA